MRKDYGKDAHEVYKIFKIFFAKYFLSRPKMKLFKFDVEQEKSYENYKVTRRNIKSSLVLPRNS